MCFPGSSGWSLSWLGSRLRVVSQLQPSSPDRSSSPSTSNPASPPSPQHASQSLHSPSSAASRSIDTELPQQPIPEPDHAPTTPRFLPVPAVGRPAVKMALDEYYHNKIESMKLEILKGQAALRRLEAQRNDYNSRVRLLREELGLLQQPGSYVGEVVKVMSTKKVLVKVHPEGKYGTLLQSSRPEIAMLLTGPFC